MPVPKYAISYINKNNTATLKIVEKQGYKKFEERLDRKLLSFDLRAVRPVNSCSSAPSSSEIDPVFDARKGPLTHI